MKKKTLIIIITVGCILGIVVGTKTIMPHYRYNIGEKLDSLNGVYVYYNRSISNVEGRYVKDGYNIGLKYQCVEFVKRYYYEHLNHKMPDSYGHAKSFFDKGVKDGQLNKARNLKQFTNPSKWKPAVNDLIVMGGSKYGHVAIISEVTDKDIEIIQQNPGINGKSRVRIDLSKTSDNLWYIEKERILGWLRK